MDGIRAERGGTANVGVVWLKAVPFVESRGEIGLRDEPGENSARTLGGDINELLEAVLKHRKRGRRIASECLVIIPV